VKTLRRIDEVRAELRGARRAGRTIGLVPTMGAFHEGHLSLIRRARERADVVVVSLFVNPTQFNDPADLERYPRDEARDAELAADLGVDVLFAPDPGELYPDGFATTVRVAGLGDVLEGAHRPGHFEGVATVVTKLLNIVGPDVAYFGQKDAQQAMLIKRLVRDLNLPVEIDVRPTVREPDGLALSSRNALLNEDERARAVALSRALDAARRAVQAGEHDAAAVRERALAAMHDFDIEPEYLELVSPDTLAPLERIDGEALALVAARVGPARLIDNAPIHVDSAVATPTGANR
jgi:pantoate--beta-alanine ligase